MIPVTRAAHAHGKAIRVDEINSVSCFGAQGVSNTFAAALWALETSFAMARVGVDGVNFHTLPGAVYGLFSFRRVHGRWAGHVAPAYYGLLAFAKAAPAGAKLLATSGTAHGLRTWATQSPDGTTHVVVINTGHHARTVGLRLPGEGGVAALSYLRARTLRSRTLRLGQRHVRSLNEHGCLIRTARHPASGRPAPARTLRRGRPLAERGHPDRTARSCVEVTARPQGRAVPPRSQVGCDDRARIVADDPGGDAFPALALADVGVLICEALARDRQTIKPGSGAWLPDRWDDCRRRQRACPS